jgi:SAM-dependent methyltransferase
MAEDQHEAPPPSFWEERYSQAEMVYGEAPNAFFAQSLARLAPGRLLLPLEGEGRNALHALQQGWRVEAFDFSQAGRQKLAQLVARYKLPMPDYRILDVADFVAPPGRYDAVALIYAHLPPALRRAAHREFVRALRPGGQLVLEAFTPRQLAYNSGGPPREALLYEPAALREDFRALTELSIVEKTVELAEGRYHAGPAKVVRVVGEKRSQEGATPQ